MKIALSTALLFSGAVLAFSGASVYYSANAKTNTPENLPALAIAQADDEYSATQEIEVDDSAILTDIEVPAIGTGVAASSGAPEQQAANAETDMPKAQRSPVIFQAGGGASATQQIAVGDITTLADTQTGAIADNTILTNIQVAEIAAAIRGDKDEVRAPLSAGTNEIL